MIMLVESSPAVRLPLLNHTPVSMLDFFKNPNRNAESSIEKFCAVTATEKAFKGAVDLDTPFAMWKAHLIEEIPIATVSNGYSSTSPPRVFVICERENRKKAEITKVLYSCTGSVSHLCLNWKSIKDWKTCKKSSTIYRMHQCRPLFYQPPLPLFSMRGKFQIMKIMQISRIYAYLT